MVQCLSSYFEDPGKFAMVLSVGFQASTGKKLWKKSWKNHETKKFDAKNSANSPVATVLLFKSKVRIIKKLIMIRLNSDPEMKIVNGL